MFIHSRHFFMNLPISMCLLLKRLPPRHLDGKCLLAFDCIMSCIGFFALLLWNHVFTCFSDRPSSADKNSISERIGWGVSSKIFSSCALWYAVKRPLLLPKSHTIKLLIDYIINLWSVPLLPNITLKFDDLHVFSIIYHRYCKAI